VSGPYETERQAAAAARHIYDLDVGAGLWRDGSLRMLEDACRAAGVQLGAYDYRVLLWLAGWEPQTCAVVAGWVTRAAAGRVAPPTVQEMWEIFFREDPGRRQLPASDPR